ncbi:hypothetical protein ABIC32_001457 [Brevundimonas sp. 1080]|uniref:lasso peptide biosynthesis B2 protein n=1 Tax=Brevundimonas sp. 1080 TaxID=3156405 RepID=UPI003399F9C4
MQRDAYLCLVGAASAITDEGGGRIGLAGPDVLTLLATAGLAQAEPDPCLRPTAMAPRAAISPFDVPSSPVGLGFLISALISSRHYHGRGFSELIARARRIKRQSPRPTTLDLQACVSAYRSGLPLTPRQGVCLHRSFMLLHYLKEQAISADWVFGVRTWPFAAHCWLQIGDVVVGDDLHRVSRYTPILIV